MAITSPPPAPQRGDRATFSTRFDAFLLWLTNLVPQLNAFLSGITTLAAGGANSFAFIFDTATADADPGSGKIRLGSATQNSATVIRLDNAASTGGDITAFLAALAAGTSNIKGSVRLQRVTDASVWMLFDITGVTAKTGYNNITVVPRASSSTSPFAADDTLMVFFDVKGDKGDGGNTPTQAEMRAAIGTLGIENGGTGSTTANGALANLGGLPLAGGQMSGQLRLAAGSAGVPSLSFANDGTPDTGLYHISDGAFGVTCNTVPVVRYTSGTVLQFGSLVQRASTGDGTDRVLFEGQQQNSILRFRWLIGSNSSPLLQTFNTNGVHDGTTTFGGGAIHTSGPVSAASLSATSDETLKSNWRAAPANLLDEFAQLEKVGLFDWIEDGKEDGGIGAQSLQKIAPWAVWQVGEQLRVNHSAFNTVINHQLAQRVRRIEAALARAGIEL